VIIPAGQKSGTAKVTALKKGPISGELRAFATYYGGTLCHLTIKAAPAPPPTPPTPSKRQQSWKMLLQWQAPARGGLVYVWGQTYPIPNGKLKKVRNINTTYPWRHHLWFPGPGFSTDDAFDPNKGYLLNSGAEATPAQLNLPESLDRSFLIGATPSPIDLPPTTPLPDMGSVYIELVYET
jgi:hypothetical protein